LVQTSAWNSRLNALHIDSGSIGPPAIFADLLHQSEAQRDMSECPHHAKARLIFFSGRRPREIQEMASSTDT
jgi:hypothetical protein